MNAIDDYSSKNDEEYMSYTELTTSESNFPVSKTYTGPVTRRRRKRVSFNEVVDVKNVGKIYTTPKIRGDSFYTAAQVNSFNYDAYMEQKFKEKKT